MSWFDAAVLGLVQGVTEFLPVSSSGHLVIAQEALGLRGGGVLFEVLVHVGTLVSVVWVYRGALAELLLGAARGDREAWTSHWSVVDSCCTASSGSSIELFVRKARSSRSPA